MGVLPDPEEARRYTVGPHSTCWRVASDARLMMAAGAALMLQVAHPTVGAGVKEHSNFQKEPWDRLFRTLDFVNLLIYGGPERAIATGRGMREIHKRIKGTKPDGTPYHSLEPEAYAWVHATLAETIIASRVRFVGPLERWEVDAFWTEWRGLGRLLGVRDQDLPETWPEFRAYVDWMARERLEHTASVDDVLHALQRPSPPPIRGLTPSAWKVASMPASRAVGVATVGLLPPVVRERLGMRWTPGMERELRAMGRMSRVLTPVAPEPVRRMGPAYLRWRGDKLAMPSAEAFTRRQAALQEQRVPAVA